MLGEKKRQQHGYNKQVRPLEPISISDTVRMRLSRDKTWSPRTGTAEAGPRSYKVQVGSAIFRRNRRQLIKTGEPNEATVPEDTARQFRPRHPGNALHQVQPLSHGPSKATRWLKDFVTP